MLAYRHRRGTHMSQTPTSAIAGFVARLGFEDLPPEEMLPPASKLPAVASVDEALRLLAEDRQVALRHLASANEAALLTDRYPAPWGGPELTLFQHLLSMVTHLRQHKGQLFYYLKLMGHDVSTPDLWG